MIGSSGKSTGLVLDLPMQEGSGVTVYDKSRWKNNGTITGATWVKLPSGAWVMSFDGADDRITCGDNISLDITTAITIEVWVKLLATSGATNRHICGRDDGVNRNYAMIQSAGTDTFQFIFWIGGVLYSAGSAVSSLDGKFHYIVGVYTGATHYFSLDGASMGGGLPVVGAIGNDDVSFTIGERPSGDRDLQALIGQIRIYNWAFNSRIIANRYQTTKGLYL